MLTGCADLKGSTPVSSASDSTADSSQTTSVDVEELIQDDWVTIDDAVPPPPAKPVEFNNKREDYTAEQAAEIINSIDKFTAAENLYIDLPSSIEHLSYYTERRLGKEGFPPLKEQVKHFFDMFRYFFKDAVFYPDYFYLKGIKQNDEKPTPKYIPFYKNYQDIIDGKVLDEYYNIAFVYDDLRDSREADNWADFYDETALPLYEGTPRDGLVGFYTLYPSAGAYFVVDKGEFGKILYERGDISTYMAASASPSYFDELVEVLQPDSEKSYKLLDKEISVKDAVKVYEDYVNSIPSIVEPEFNFKTFNVYVCRIDDVYAYIFNSVREYDGIKYDYMGDLYDVEGVSLSADNNIGLMIRSDEVDILEGNYMRAMEIADKTERTDMMSFEEAAKEISGKLTDHVDFEINEARLVYLSKQEENKELEWVDFIIAPYYKITAHNLNDDRYYYCYLNACDKEDFLYFSSNNFSYSTIW